MNPEPIPFQPEPVIPPSIPLTRKFNPLLISAAVVLLIVVGAAGIFLGKSLNNSPKSAQPTIAPIPTSTPHPTASWNTYINNQYGYTIKYPSELAYKLDRFYFIGDEQREDTADGFGPNLSIFYRGNDQNLTPSQVVQQELNGVQLKDAAINNAEGVEVVNAPYGFDYYLSPKFGAKVFIRISFNSQSYVTTVSKESISRMKTIADQMLSTFKFLD